MTTAQRIFIANLNNAYKLNGAFLKKIIVRILKFVKKPRGIRLEVIFLDDNKIRDLNKIYKHKDRATDVLSFGMEVEEFGYKTFLGEVFVSPDAASRNSETFETRFEDELVLYIIHGLLHLFGFRDGTKIENAEMIKKQNYILRRICRREDLSKVLMRR